LVERPINGTIDGFDEKIVYNSIMNSERFPNFWLRTIALFLVTAVVAWLIQVEDARILVKIDRMSPNGLLAYEHHIYQHSYTYHFFGYLLIGGLYLGVAELIVYILQRLTRGIRNA